ncbi:hypothetical protein IMCC3317_09150 [Kordia antarctica]|uniref:Protein with DOMON-like ligand-binding domain protein n=1 Tax=Kordia antarctica TaxID=1218801 RepID=A0A7L4ZGL5_9FLAO|nr:DUF5916 domain-containing protein [Kordia antarctica]QHI35569.1 hypothetical protein IMCC3317_09150 [Kordia antarctica]
MRIKLTFSFILLLSFITHAQNKKQLAIARTTEAPKIDGILDDAVWKTAKEATGFTQFRPNVGVPDTEENKTVVKMTYDDTAIYIAAYLYDDPEKIMRQFTSRDNFGQSDFFGLILNPNNDAQNDTEFFVFSSGTQADAVANPSNGEDFGWNAVWDSAVKINDDGWSVEMKIPYRALRFSNREVQTWGIQFHRHFRRDRSQYTWNPLDISKGNVGLYHGELTGLKNIEPPTRLSFYPFMSGLTSSFDGQTESDFNVGLDVKYGITENFTLDMTLIPDFSQAGFDNLVLNLGPFEQTFSEQRQFFTEGVDLFNKGNLFFSRRVGSRPSGNIELSDTEEIIKRPKTVKVINAAKVSGRTKKGLGIGVFNAVTEKTNASIRDTETGEFRDQVVEPLANYNIIVLDQQFNGNSSVSLINTNVTREGSFRDANVTGVLADLTNKRNTYNVEGQIKMSNVNDLDGTTTGFSSFFVARKVHGNYRYSFDHSYADDKYNINDLGLQFRNNFNNFGIDASYRIFKPTEKLNNYYIGTYVNYRRLANPNTYTGGNGGINFDAQTKTLHNFGANVNYQFGKQFDYFEPRQDGRFFIYEDRINANVRVSTNYNNTFAIDANIGGATFFEKGRDSNDFWFNIGPRIQVNDKFIISYSFSGDMSYKNRGYATTVGNDIIFGQRDRKTLINRMNVNYNFNPFHSLGLTFRNYWSTVTYENDLFTLKENGRLDRSTGYEVGDLENNPNINFSTWNLDLSYSWQFAPGSFLTALYRNQLFNSDNASEQEYFSALSTLLEQPIQHTFSLRLQYFIDYNDVKQLLRNKKKNNINS